MRVCRAYRSEIILVHFAKYVNLDFVSKYETIREIFYAQVWLQINTELIRFSFVLWFYLLHHVNLELRILV